MTGIGPRTNTRTRGTARLILHRLHFQGVMLKVHEVLESIWEYDRDHSKHNGKIPQVPRFKLLGVKQYRQTMSEDWSIWAARVNWWTGFLPENVIGVSYKDNSRRQNEIEWKWIQRTKWKTSFFCGSHIHYGDRFDWNDIEHAIATVHSLLP